MWLWYLITMRPWKIWQSEGESQVKTAYIHGAIRIQELDKKLGGLLGDPIDPMHHFDKYVDNEETANAILDKIEKSFPGSSVSVSPLDPLIKGTGGGWQYVSESWMCVKCRTVNKSRYRGDEGMHCRKCDDKVVFFEDMSLKEVEKHVAKCKVAA